jgi:hypothetical protein
MATMQKTTRRRMIGLVVLAFAIAVEPDPAQWIHGTGLIEAAEARVGRPATPVSAAGVARRTTRRVVRRTTVYVASLPAGCVTTVINGVQYHQCGSTYYEYYGGQYVVVVVD